MILIVYVTGYCCTYVIIDFCSEVNFAATASSSAKLTEDIQYSITYVSMKITR